MAQPDNATDSDSGEWGFKSLRAGQKITAHFLCCYFLFAYNPKEFGKMLRKSFNGFLLCFKYLTPKTFLYYNLSYSSSVTGSSHSFDDPSAGTSTARCANQLSLAAPCQCLTSGGIFTTSPGLSICASLPNS